MCSVAALFYFRSIEINGKGDVPVDGLIIFAPNHQNAFLDGILIGIFSHLRVSFFTRGDIFVKPYLWLLKALSLLPVFRAKDGFSMSAQNGDTFDIAVKTLLSQKPLMIFPEANHDYPYILRTLSKGTARIGFLAQKATDKNVYIVPVGLNYFRRHSPRFKLIINYGKPICIKDYMKQYADHKGKALSAVKKEMTTRLKKEMLVPDRDEKYEEQIIKVFNRKNESLTFIELCNTKFEALAATTFKWLKPLVFLLSIPNIIPFLFSKYLISLFKDPVFQGSIKFGVAALFCPLWYTFLFIIIGFGWNFNISTIIIAVSIALLFARQELKRLYTDTEYKFITKW